MQHAGNRGATLLAEVACRIQVAGRQVILEFGHEILVLLGRFADGHGPFKEDEQGNETHHSEWQHDVPSTRNEQLHDGDITGDDLSGRGHGICGGSGVLDSGTTKGQVLDAHQDEGRNVGCDHDVGLKSNVEGRSFRMPLAVSLPRVSTFAVFTPLY